jgi:hypothetical protein
VLSFNGNTLRKPRLCDTKHRQILSYNLLFKTSVADPPALLKQCLKYSSSKKHCASSKHTYLRSVCGAFDNAVLHGYVQQPKLSHHATWKRTLKDLAVEVAAADVKFPSPATPPDIDSILRRERHDPPMTIAIAITYSFASRLTTTLPIRIPHVKLQPHTSRPQTPIAIKFCRGKTIGTTGPYTVHSSLPSWVADRLRVILATKRGTHLFSPTDRSRIRKQMCSALRRERSNLEVKSVRRGALQTMAKNRVPIDTIMLFSRHTTRAMCLRYLDFGLQAYEDADKTTAAAKPLWVH